ncbi:hypothetical protein [Shimia sp.]|uniref:glycosyltransferase family 2 protein n=1 Tax=Shimia sp. TaxID=1954381 RepID=UPI0032988CB0
MHSAITHLSSDLRAWAEQTLPITVGEDIAAFGLDRPARSHSRLADLFFNTDLVDHLVPGAEADTPFLRGQSLSSAALRNMLFPATLRNHSAARQIGLHFSVSGAFAYRLHTHTPGETPEELDTGLVENNRPEHDTLPAACCHIDIEHDLDKQARLSWELEALGDDCVLHDMALSLNAPRDVGGRMVVIMRTFGRTNDIIELLTRFDAQSHLSAGYRRALRNIFFLVLDTTGDVDEDSYSALAGFDHLHVHVLSGANMGGGGNMSQSLLLLEDALKKSEQDIDELLLLDDDLQISLESLRRHWATTLFRTDDVIFTLPVSMKSAPRKIWEDGAFWGRFLDADRTGARTAIAPRLLRHGGRMDDPDQADKLTGLHYPEYSTFIFFGLSHARFRALGYPSAFFLRGDDIEYSLRHGAAGGKCLSNPNLWAWHEPAHSYGQEYMSIAHGVIINMRYGAEVQTSFVRFFKQRLLAHAAISDAPGLRLYADVLRDLNDHLLLEHEFAQHYVTRLGEFRTYDGAFDYVPDEVRADIRASAARRGESAVETSFLYPGGPKQDTVARVLLHNPHTDRYRVYDPQEAAILSETVTATAALARELARFQDGFDDLRAHYAARMQEVAGAEFWREELTRHAAPRTLFGIAPQEAPQPAPQTKADT